VAPSSTVTSEPRRIPVQRRSRERVEGILLAAEQIVVREDFDALSTRAVAERAKVPVATLYQYFADRDAIIAALIDRHVSAMDVRLTEAVAALGTYSVRSLAQVVVDAYVAGYRAHPSYVVLWFQGRVSADIVARVRERTSRLAAQFHGFALAAGLLKPDTDVLVLEVAADAIDGVLDMAYRNDVEGDPRVLDAGIEMIVSYLERHATPAGIAGVSSSDLAARWEPPGE
jgi:AcrR family transcriptional regulator